MKIEVNISKKHLFAFVFILVAFSTVFFAYAYNSSPANPPVFGHTASEVDPGTFGGNSNSQWQFPGLLRIGGTDAGFRNLFVANYSSSGQSVIGISGAGSSGLERIAFLHDGAEKALISWRPSSNSLEVNEIYSSDTVLNRVGGKVGIGLGAVGGSPLATLHVRTPDNIIVEHTSGTPTAARAPAISLKEFASAPYWEIIKRGSTYGTTVSDPTQNNELLFSYYNGASWQTPLSLKSDGSVCINSVCKSDWSTTSWSAMPSGSWCGFSNAQFGPTINCQGMNPASGCPTGYSQVLWYDASPSPKIFTCVKQ